MGEFEFPQSLIDRVITLRGTLHPFDALEPSRTALVAIDMQNIFVAPGAAYEVPAARGIVRNINRLARAVRETGGVVSWVQMTYAPSYPWSNFYHNMLDAARFERLVDGLTEGSEGHALWPEMDVRDGDLVVKKTRFSAFLPGYCDLGDCLAARSVDTVLITGTLTNTCCECSARDAMMLDHKTIMVSDANASILEELHAATLHNFIQVLGDVRSTGDVMALLEGGAARAAKPAVAE